MEKLKHIKNDIIFSPAKVDAEFWSKIQEIYQYLMSPEDLFKLYEENPEEYLQLTGYLGAFIIATEEELANNNLTIDQISED